MIKRLICLSIAIFIASAFIFSESPDMIKQTIASMDNTETVQFTAFILIQGGLEKKTIVPNFAYRQLKSYPLKVREFLKNIQYSGYSKADFKLKAEEIVATMTDKSKKNAVLVAKAVCDYINLSITASPELAISGLTQADCYATPLNVINIGKGNLIEKNRLAVQLLRYFDIPARMAYWSDHYVVQYFLKPLETEKISQAWHIMDFTNQYDKLEGKIEPVSWHAVTAKELYNVNWKGETISLDITKVKNTHMEITEGEALALFTNLERGNVYAMEDNPTLTRYYLLKEITYSMNIPKSLNKLVIELILPFNETQPFKTLKYYVKIYGNAKAICKRTHTMINPPNRGIVYTLPVEFEFLDAGKVKQ
ncbi:MAG: hypothetical protein WCJ94_07480 [bacterium]